MITYHSSYYEKVLSSVEALTLKVEECFALLFPIKDSFDAIAVTGVSGLVVGAPLAVMLRKQLVVIRKDGVQSHAERKAEGLPSGEYNYIILDDMVCSGATLRRIKSEMHGGTCVKTCLYGCYDDGELRDTWNDTEDLPPNDLQTIRYELNGALPSDAMVSMTNKYIG